MKILSILFLLLLLTNCSAGGGNGLAKIKLGPKCTASDANQMQEKSYIWFVSADAIKDFDTRINKANCSDS